MLGGELNTSNALNNEARYVSIFTNLAKTTISPIDTTNQCREKCIPNLCVHEIYLDNLTN